MKLQRRKKNRRVSREPRPARSRIRQLPAGLVVRLRYGLVFSVLLTAGLGLSWQLQNWLFGVDGLTLKQVQVESNFEHISRAEVRQLVAPYAGQSFFDLDVEGLKQRLYQQPWVRQATVRRQWPDGLYIKLYEQQPVARWGERGLINNDGGLFFPEGELPAGIPRLDGVQHSEHLLLTRMRDVGELLQPLKLKIVAMSLDERRAWSIELDNGLRLMLGREQDMQRIQRFVAFYPTLLAARLAEVGVVDLRYPNGIVLRWLAPQGKDVQLG